MTAELLPEHVEVVEGDIRRCTKCQRWRPVSAFKTDERVCHACRRLRLHHITYADYIRMLDAQGGACAICRSPKSGGDRMFNVDHDHACCPTKYSCGACVRGLLCTACNHLLGNARDNIDTLRSAIDYLERTVSCIVSSP